MAILVLTVPIVVPPIINLGYGPIWWGAVLIVTAELGMVTLPLGLNAFVVARYSGAPVGEVFRSILPHFIAIAILLLFPALSLWLPKQM